MRILFKTGILKKDQQFLKLMDSKGVEDPSQADEIVLSFLKSDSMLSLEKEHFINLITAIKSYYGLDRESQFIGTLLCWLNTLPLDQYKEKIRENFLHLAITWIFSEKMSTAFLQFIMNFLEEFDQRHSQVLLREFLEMKPNILEATILVANPALVEIVAGFGMRVNSLSVDPPYGSGAGNVLTYVVDLMYSKNFENVNLAKIAFYFWERGAIISLKKSQYYPKSFKSFLEICSLFPLAVGLPMLQYELEHNSLTFHIDLCQRKTPFTNFSRQYKELSGEEPYYADAQRVFGLFLKSGADVNGVKFFEWHNQGHDWYGEPPLVDFCLKGKVEEVKALISRGVDATLYSCTPAFIAAIQATPAHREKALEILKLLITYNRSSALLATSVEGLTAVAAALLLGDLALLMLLVKEYRLPLHPVLTSHSTPFESFEQFLRKTPNSSTGPLFKKQIECLKFLVTQGMPLEEAQRKWVRKMVSEAKVVKDSKLDKHTQEFQQKKFYNERILKILTSMQFSLASSPEFLSRRKFLLMYFLVHGKWQREVKAEAKEQNTFLAPDLLRHTIFTNSDLVKIIIDYEESSYLSLSIH